MTTLYEKKGRKYLPHSEIWAGGDRMRVGEFRLTYCYREGWRRYSYEVTPDTAGFVAAATIAEVAMENAIIAASVPHRSAQIPYTVKQLEILERFRAEMQAAGALLPDWWQHTRPVDIARAGINAVRNWRP